MLDGVEEPTSSLTHTTPSNPEFSQLDRPTPSDQVDRTLFRSS